MKKLTLEQLNTVGSLVAEVIMKNISPDLTVEWRYDGESLRFKAF